MNRRKFGALALGAAAVAAVSPLKAAAATFVHVYASYLHFKPTTVSQYLGVKWYDAAGALVAKIIAHEEHPNGDIHKHVTFYSGNAAGGLTGRMHIEYGDDHARIVIGKKSDLYFGADGARLVMKSPDGKKWAIAPDNNGTLTVTQV